MRELRREVRETTSEAAGQNAVAMLMNIFYFRGFNQSVLSLFNASMRIPHIL